MTREPERSVVAMDVGYSQVKAVAGFPGCEPVELRLPSGACPAEQLPVDGQGQPVVGKGCLLESGGEPWGALLAHGHGEATSRILDHRYPESKAYYSNVLAAAMRLGVRDASCLVLGLPVEAFYGTGNADRLRRKFLGRHEIGGGRSVSFAEVDVIPQPLGAYWQAMNRVAELRRFMDDDSRLLVVDPGCYSVDFVVIAGAAIRRTSSGSSLAATSAVLEGVRRELGAREQTTIRLERLEDALMSGSRWVRARGRMLDFSDALEVSARSVADRLMKQLLASLRADGGDVDAVLVAGGGAPVFAPMLREEFGTRVHVLDEPAMANARGYFLWGNRRRGDAR